jgi:hypothetical protein
MVQNNLRQSLLAGKTPKNLRLLIARGLAPVSSAEMLDLLICLLKDNDPEIALQANQTIESWEIEEILAQLKSRNCSPSTLEYFAEPKYPESMHQAIIANPSSPGKIIASLALTVPPSLLESILENLTRIISFPGILQNIRKNPSATPSILRLTQEIEVEFMGSKRTEYSIGKVDESIPIAVASPEIFQTSELESQLPLEDLSLEGLPLDGEEREAAITHRISSMSVREKVRYALFGSREIRSVLVRDSNKEVARTVLRSPKLRENEVESIASMRNISEDILREIGNSREWTKSYLIVQNLVKNPKTPPVISQRLMFRLRAQDLMLMKADRSIPDSVRSNATRLLKQRSTTRQS